MKALRNRDANSFNEVGATNSQSGNDPDEEIQDLLPSRNPNGSAAPRDAPPIARITSNRRMLIAGFGIVTVFTILGLRSVNPSSSKRLAGLKASKPLFVCPKSVAVPENYDESFKDDYNKASNAILAQASDKNDTEFLTLLLNYIGFDGWGADYAGVKSKLYPWKSKHLIPHIVDGGSIYESASGVGLNLFMTLDILKDMRPEVRNIEINGNEYVEESTKISQILYDKQLPSNARKGVICTGDSMKLDEFVPADSFDVVYTGYISTLLNPLDLTFGDLNENRRYYKKLCLENSDDWRSLKLNDIAQERQEEWFGKWVYQMARIAKPGAPVVIEQVAPPFCAIVHDWGGVSRDWWPQAISKYASSWDIDPDSLIIENANGEQGNSSRYNVFMRKNK